MKIIIELDEQDKEQIFEQIVYQLYRPRIRTSKVINSDKYLNEIDQIYNRKTDNNIYKVIEGTNEENVW